MPKETRSLTFTQLTLAVLSLALLSPAVSNAAISWRMDVNRAVSEASSSGKPLLVSVSTDWCHYCKKMDQETLSDSGVEKHIETCFVPLKVDGDENKELAEKLGVRSFPTMVIISPKMKVLTTVKGYRTAEQLTQTLDSICLAGDAHHQHDAERVSHSAPSQNSQRQLSAFGVHCPVTSFHSKKLVKGTQAFGMQFRGFDVWFASAEAKKEFQKTPHRYWPVIDGHCVVSGVDENLLRQGSWEHGVSYADRIWFFSSQEQMERFAAQPMGYFDRLVKITNAR